MVKNKNNDERRRYQRINKKFILSYFERSNPSQKFEITQLKNISLGGMCFIASRPLELSSNLQIELRTPYLSDRTHFDGKVLESHEKVRDMIYEIRTEFNELNSQAKFLIEKLMEVFLNDSEGNNE